VNILLIDDHPIVLEALASILKPHFPDSNIVSVQSAALFQRALATSPTWDGIIVDLNFNGEFKGFEIIEAIKSASSDIPVIVLSMHTEAAIIRKALDYGAYAYVTKTEAPSEIFKAFRHIQEGRTYISQFSSDALKSADACKTALSKREVQIAKFVMQGETSKSIAKKLTISVRTVEAHRNNIMRKMGAKNTAQLIGLLRRQILSI
jgi:DNA-binding NarL/FixJ family response regulator